MENVKNKDTIPGKINLQHEYNRIKERIDAIDFSALWEGFHTYRFALYNETECFFDGRYIEKTDAFCVNTSIVYNGENIAIWMLTEEPTDIDSLICRGKKTV